MNQKKAISLLKKYAKDEEQFRKVLAHSKAVQKAALKIAKKISNADIEFIKLSSLLHDIGRFSCKPGTKESIRHGIKGADILRKEKLPKFAKVAERHMGVGITKQDIIKSINELRERHIELYNAPGMPGCLQAQEQFEESLKEMEEQVSSLE